MKKGWISWIAFGILLLLFLLVRYQPLRFQTVGYTYDQGRDFLKAAEMIQTHKPTFIGPTTGINGLYHGAWWYYVLAIPFLLFRGSPIGFYYFNLVVQFAAFAVFFLFAKKYFGATNAILLGLLIVFSPYFIFTSLFVGNNIMVLPVMLGFLITNFKIIEGKALKKPLLLSFLTGLFLGLIGEFELSFGLFLIPAYVLSVIVIKKLRLWFLRFPQPILLLLGLIVAFTPRILFEIKNKFIQTKTLLSFFLKPKLYNPKPYLDVVIDRMILFKGYYEGLFPHYIIAIVFTIIIAISAILFIKNKKKIYVGFLSFITFLIFTLFVFSTAYKDNFWGNYYEGIQYLFIAAFGVLISQQRKHLLSYVKVLMIGTFIIVGLMQIRSSFAHSPKYEGLAVQRAVVSYILTHEKDTQHYCVRVYTPPLIPYTYNYLFAYEKMKTGVSLPGSEWVSGTCWFIMEPDPFHFRLADWKRVNEPEKKSKITSMQIQDVLINHYEVLE